MANDIWGSGVGLAVAGLRQKFREMNRLEVDMIAMDKPGFTKTIQESSIIYSNGRAIGIAEGDLQEVTDIGAENQLRSLAAQAKSTAALEKYVSQYLNAFGEMGGSNAFITSGNKVVTAINTLCSQGGESPSNKKAVIDAINFHALQINNVANTLQGLRDSSSQDLASQIPQINQLLSDIASINSSMGSSGATSDSNISYQRQRRDLLNQLAGYMQINVEDNAANSDFLVYTPNGRVLVEGSLAAELIYTPPAQINASQTFGAGTITLQSVAIDTTVLEAPSTGTDVSPPGDPNYYDRRQEAFIFDISSDFASAQGGSISGIISFLQGDSVLFAQELDAYAAGLRDSFNATHNLSSSIAPRATLQGGGTGYIGGTNLAETLGIAGVGTLRVAVINTATNLAIYSADIDISGVTTVNNAVDNTSLCHLINTNAGLNNSVTASIVNDSLQITTTQPSCGISLGSVSGSALPTISLSPPGSIAYGFSEFFHLNDVLTAPAAYWRGGPITGLASNICVNSTMLATPDYFSIKELRNDALLGATAQAVSGDSVVGRLLSDLFTRTKTSFVTPTGETVLQTLEVFSSGLVKEVANEVRTLQAEKEAQTEAYKQQEALFSQEYGMSEEEIAILSLQISRSQELYFAFINNYLNMTSMIAEMGK